MNETINSILHDNTCSENLAKNADEKLDCFELIQDSVTLSLKTTLVAKTPVALQEKLVQAQSSFKFKSPNEFEAELTKRRGLVAALENLAVHVRCAPASYTPF